MITIRLNELPKSLELRQDLAIALGKFYQAIKEADLYPVNAELTAAFFSSAK